ncbi:MAG: hypothetical protein Q9218_003479 [Villophora microphyllina]
MSTLEDPSALPPKTEDPDEDSFSDSSHEFDGPEGYPTEAAQVQKRKGGRKPIYATSEERKQRNRQAQAAFRERRTEYIKQLETTIKQHEDSLQSLQQSHRHAADECLMLRYKNSLLERILLEKGIDVQAELRSKTDTTHVTPNLPTAAASQPSPMQRAVTNRHNRTRRAGSTGGARGPKSQSSQTSVMSDQSIRSHPTPPLTTSSPVKAKSSMSSLQSGFSGGIYPPPPLKPRRPSQGPPGLHSPNPNSALPRKANGVHKGGDLGNGLPGYYAPTFRSHIEQLEQEYDAPADMLDEDPSDQSAGPGPYPDSFYSHPMAANPQMGMGMQNNPMQAPPTSQVLDANGLVMGSFNQQLDPFNPMLDADPFGLDRRRSRQSGIMTDVKSKNLFELLGNDHDEDSDKEPEPPTKVADKPVGRAGKRNGPDAAPTEPRGGASGGDRGGRGGRRGGFAGNDQATVSEEAAFKATMMAVEVEEDVAVGVDEVIVTIGIHAAIRSMRNPCAHTKHLTYHYASSDHVKQADQSWGAPTGDAEWGDEKAGEAIAKAEEDAGGWNADEANSGWNADEANAVDPTASTKPIDAEAADTTAGVAEPAGVPEPAAEPEPEDNSRSYADYLAEQAEKKLRLGAGPLEARKPNEGSKQDKKWAQAKPLSKDEEDAEYIAGKGEKAKRERQRKEKTMLDVDFRYAEPARGGDRGRGRGRGGDRGRGGRGRGDFRGRGDGYGYRGGRGGRDGGSVNVSDENAFPTLGGGS